MKANALMKHNINAILRARGHTQKDLATWCRRSESWISKILKEDRREFPMKYFDRIADFFGITAYQLLQPGISHLTERRHVRDRRTGHDRRIGHAVQSSMEIMVLPDDAVIIRKLNALRFDTRQTVARWIDAKLLQERLPEESARADLTPTVEQQSEPIPQRQKRRSSGRLPGRA